MLRNNVLRNDNVTLGTFDDVYLAFDRRTVRMGEDGQNSLTRFETFSKIQQRLANMLKELICVPKMRPNRSFLFWHEEWRHMYLFPASIEPYSSRVLLNYILSTNIYGLETNLNGFRYQLRFYLSFLQLHRWTKITLSIFISNYSASPFPFR